MKKNLLGKIGTACILAIFAFVSVAFTVLSLSGCVLFMVQGNGDVTTETRPLSGAFFSVSSDSTVDVVIEEGVSYQATVEIDSNLQRYVELEISGETLHVMNPEATYFSATRAVVRIVMPFIESASTVGTGDMSASGFDVIGEFKAILTGTGDMDFFGTAITIKAIMEGTGSLELDGSADELVATMSGTGNLNAFACPVARASLTMMGTGNAVCTATNDVTAVLTGTGNLDVHGGADVSATVTGTGRVRELD